MAKKYLLYIHNDKFANEEKKSELVNVLLEDFYALETKLLKPIIPDILANDGVLRGKIEESALIPPKASVERLTNGLCKIHATPLDSRGKCLQKNCKYAK